MAKIKEVVQSCDLPFAVHDHFIHAVGNPSIRGGLRESLVKSDLVREIF